MKSFWSELLLPAVLAGVLPACIRLGAFACSDDGNCSQRSDGACIDGWCAYPDDDCDGLLRFSDKAGDGLAGTCVDDLPGTTATSIDPNTEGTDSETTGSVPADCGQVDCGPQGTCVEYDGVTACRCDRGYYDIAGRCEPDPCGTHTCVFVDPNAGSDGGAGTSPDDAFRTLGRALEFVGTDAADVAILVRRGTTASRLTLEGQKGTAGHEFIVGAYGPLSDPRPIVRQTNVTSASHIVIRDLEIAPADEDSALCLKFHLTDNFVVYDNMFRHCLRRGIRIENESSYGTIVGNELEDIGLEAIRIADKGWEPDPNTVGQHYYVVDNILRGPFDDFGIFLEGANSGDVKVLGNRIAASDPPAIMARSPNVWVLGNTVAGGGVADSAAIDASASASCQLAGNVLLDSAGQFRTGPGAMVEHNTTLSNAPAGWVLGGDATIERNLVLATEPPVLTSTSPQAALGTIGDNWYGPTAAAQTDVCVFSVDGSDLDFTQWTMAGFDPDSACDAIPGVAIPALDDVATWTDDELAQSLSPNATWAGCADAPGAFSCDGVRWSPHVAPLPTAPDDGQGWRGHALVRARYPDLFD